MKITIVTACYNSAQTITNCLYSVYFQTFQNVDQIVIDGNSNDNTLELISSVPNRVSAIITELDNGIYDAMNKGIMLAKGDVIGILNSDDLYLDQDVLQDVANMLTNTGADSLFADLFYVSNNDTDKILRYWKTKEFRIGSFAKGWHPPHPTFFVRKEIYEKFGMFDTNLKVSADFELMMRFLEKYKISTCYLPRPILKMRYGGESSGSIINIIKGNINCYKAFKKNGIKVSPLYFFYRAWPKVLQLVYGNKNVTRDAQQIENET
jgi:glycosyltransferase